jgi:hypothetical protein
MKSSYKIIILLSLIPQWLFVQWAANNPRWIEAYYSSNIYPKMYAFSQFLWHSFSFSIGDLLYVAMGIWLISRIRFLNKLKTWLDIGVFCAVVYFVFHLQWGLNYHRLPLKDQLNLSSGYTTESLQEVTEKFVNKTNLLHQRIVESDSLAVVIPYSNKQIFEMSQQAVQTLNPDWIDVTYSHANVKTSLFSTGLSYMGYGGYLNPLTLEAQVNGKTPAFSKPTTSCHEIAHQLGFAAENEANFIGILACLGFDDVYFQYTGAALSVRYLLRELYKRNPESATLLSNKLAVGVKKNYKELASFWKGYENPLEPYFKKSFDAYLKANDQKAGIQSYNLVVDLLVNFGIDKQTDLP